MIRILSGQRRGANLETLEGTNTRPLRGRIREALFNIIRPHLRGAIVWDLFAGSGGVGLEALSQGAERALFIECNPEAVAVINRNIQKLRFQETTQVIQSELPKGLERINSKNQLPTIIFMMPPYFSGLALDVLGSLQNVFSETQANPLICLETQSTEEILIPPFWEQVDQRKYGITTLTFLRRTQKPNP
ncbi:MAG: 16S rRNA (guanine(966)-N(2))-methyltransferase RsmD [Sumerlaeia bacterium]